MVFIFICLLICQGQCTAAYPICKLIYICSPWAGVVGSENYTWHCCPLTHWHLNTDVGITQELYFFALALPFTLCQPSRISPSHHVVIQTRKQTINSAWRAGIFHPLLNWQDICQSQYLSDHNSTMNLSVHTLTVILSSNIFNLCSLQPSVLPFIFWSIPFITVFVQPFLTIKCFTCISISPLSFISPLSPCLASVHPTSSHTVLYAKFHDYKWIV